MKTVNQRSRHIETKIIRLNANVFVVPEENKKRIKNKKNPAIE